MEEEDGTAEVGSESGAGFESSFALALAVAILTVSSGRLDMMMLRRRRMSIIVRVVDEVRLRVY